MDPVQQADDAAVKPVTAGVLLRKAREAQGLHIAALAVMLKVPVRKLEALESDRHEALGDSVFTRALAASVCRVLKTDPTAVLAALPHTGIPRFKADDSGLNTPFKTGGAVSGQQFKSRLTSPMGLAVILLLLGILLLVLLPESEQSDPAAASVPLVNATEAPRALPAAEPAAAPAPPPSDLPGSQAPSAVAQTSPAAPVGASSGDAAILMLESHGASWVEITDAQGVLQLRKILGAGEQVRSQGPLPLSVVLGRADDVAVSVRGQRLDVTAMTKANVARFEVK
ncbi:MAG: helix-turn-helix domain-containing protein [Polaromonas sp.]|nr:helix-turn-helix domain-containing protein [Polaromonas sp.]